MNMNSKMILLLAALALAGCASNRGGTGDPYEYRQGGSGNFPPTDFDRGGNRANPPPYDTQSGAFLPETDGTHLHGMESGKFPPPNPPPTQR